MKNLRKILSIMLILLFLIPSTTVLCRAGGGGGGGGGGSSSHSSHGSGSSSPYGNMINFLIFSSFIGINFLFVKNGSVSRYKVYSKKEKLCLL